MAFDRAAHRKQVAGIVEHTAGAEVLLKFLGKGKAFPAAIAADKPSPARALEGVNGRVLSIVTIARAARSSSGALVFAGELPREGQHFTDPDGRTIRIEEDRTTPHTPVLVYACAVSAP
jgi:hypothetical protein